MAKKWYVIHTQVGLEERVKRNLEQRVKSLNVEDKISQVVIPTEPVIEVHRGQKHIVKRKSLPGYLLVEMEMDNHAWSIVRNTPGVTGFISTVDEDGRLAPSALTNEQVETIFKRSQQPAPQLKVSFNIGEAVRITTGPFTDFIGKVDEIDKNKGRVRLLVSFLGRETPIEVDVTEVERI